MGRSICLAGALLMAASTAACAQSAAVVAKPAAAAQPDAAAPNVLRPGDIVRLRIWREPDLSGDFPVDETGVVMFPKLGGLPVGGETPESLKAKLLDDYREFLSHSSVEVVVLRRLRVLGAVRNPGLYPVDPTMTLGDALALAGGVTPEGNQRKLELSRNGVKLADGLSLGSSVVAARIQSGDQLYVPLRPWVSRNSGLLVSAGLGLASAFIWAVVNR